MMSQKQGQRILQAVKEKLYTTAGLRSLEMEDPAFHPWIGGSQPERDRAYHQGTVWGFPAWGVFPCGAELFPEGGKTGSAPRTGPSCELDAGRMSVSSGGDLMVRRRFCRRFYAQAWSVGEILRVYKEMEGKKMNAVEKNGRRSGKAFLNRKNLWKTLRMKGMTSVSR